MNVAASALSPYAYSITAFARPGAAAPEAGRGGEPQDAAATGKQTGDANAGRGREEGASATERARNAGATTAAGQQLSEAEARVLAQLQQRHDEVRAHEMAHLAASAGLAIGGASYSYQTGPDGKRYAVGGEVNIDTSPGRTPEETLQKAERIRAAALAPAEPSAQDRKVAAQASQMAAAARIEIALQQREAQEASAAAGAESTAAAAKVEGASDSQESDPRARKLATLIAEPPPAPAIDTYA